MDAGQWPVRENICYLYTHYSESCKSLEGDRGRDRER